jgi:hypothetical protein
MVFARRQLKPGISEGYQPTGRHCLPPPIPEFMNSLVSNILTYPPELGLNQTPNEENVTNKAPSWRRICWGNARSRRPPPGKSSLRMGRKYSIMRSYIKNLREEFWTQLKQNNGCARERRQPRRPRIEIEAEKQLREEEVRKI